MIKNFRVNIILRVLVITLILSLLIFYLFVYAKYLRSIYLFIFLILAIVEFIWYIDRSNRDFAVFLQALLQDDFTTTFSESGKGQSFSELHKAYNQITNKFRSISSEKETQHIYLEALIEHVNVGILSYDQNERIHLMNLALKKLIHKPRLAYLKSLGTVDQELFKAVKEIKPGERKLIKLSIHNKLLQISLQASEFKLQNQYYKLVSLQNIKNELDANEMDAWQKLIRVLTHEIMNSVTPVSSLTETLYQIVDKQKEKGLSSAEIPKILQGLDAIKNRSDGLQSFTQAYRNLTKIPPPKFKTVEIKTILDRIQVLLDPDLKKLKFEIYYKDSNQSVVADPDLLEQVFINLIKNSIEALENTHNPQLNIIVSKTEKTSIKITDNGGGIAPDKIDQVFVPFFTTKKNGSGIGLALSKQILRLHSGTINIESTPGEGTCFILEL